MKKITFLTVLLTLFMCFGGFAQNTWYVTSEANGGSNVDGDGSQSFPYATPFFANDIASDGDTIIIDGEVIQPGTVNLTKSLTFSGINDAAIVGAPDFDPQARLFSMPNDPEAEPNPPALSFTFNGIEFRNFKAKDEFGDDIPDVSGVVFNNQGRPNVEATFNDCVFNGNISSANGGAVFVNNNAVLTINDCLFRNNTAGVSGGGLYINSVEAGPNVNITGTTFYQNLAQGLLGSNGGAAILKEGTVERLGQLNVINCTFYQNYTTKGNLDYGCIRSTNANISVTNSLFYENKVDGGAGGSGDFGSAPGGDQSFTFSIGEWISSNVDVRENYIALLRGDSSGDTRAADLSASNLRFDEATGKVIYDNVGAGVDSPIDFGSDGNDVGAWDSGFTLSLDREDFLATQLTVFFNKTSKRLEVIHTINAPVSAEIYNILGAKVLTVDEVASEQSINANGLKAGIYIFKGKTSEKFFTKKFIVN